MTNGGATDKNAPPVEELRRQLTALKAEVTSQQWLLEALESQSAQYRALFDLMPGSVVLLDVKGFIRDANPYFCRTMGYTREELVGKHVTQFSQEPSEVIERNIRRMISGEILQHEVANVQKDGSLRFYELREAAVTLPDGSMNILAVSNDVTDRRRAEQARLDVERQLFHSQKLDGLGVLAGGIAHDFNNLLATILSNIEVALSGLPAASPAQNLLTDALLAGKRAAELTRQMLTYSGHGRSATAELDLSKLVQDVTDLLKASVSKSVRLDISLASDLPSIRADAAQLQQVLINLVSNSSEVIGNQPGTVSISAYVREYGASILEGTWTANKPKPGRYAVLEVKDSGEGMDETVRARLADPLFKTRYIGRGLGLSAVLSVVEAHNGAVMLLNEPGKGTVISVLFPVAPAVARAANKKE
jgi:PAS domain S-box-containing protein